MHLVVIDMQNRFASSLPIQDQVIQAIEKAKQLKFHIHLVEYAGYGRSLTAITKAVKNYNRLNVIEKYGDDGSHEIMRKIYHIDRKNLPIWICGVNLCACVVLTLSGMIVEDEFLDIYDRQYFVLKTAVNCHEDHTWKLKRGKLKDKSIRCTNGQYDEDWVYLSAETTAQIQVETLSKMRVIKTGATDFSQRRSAA